MRELPDDVKAQIARNKYNQYRGQLYDASLDLRIAERLGDESMRQRVLRDMRRIEEALAVLEEELGDGQD